MTKRLHYSLDEVLDQVASDDDDMDDPEEPMMEGSDDEFSDLEIDEDDIYEDDRDNVLDTTGSDSITGSATQDARGLPTLVYFLLQ